MVEVNWEMIESVGVAGVALFALYVIYKVVLLFIHQWKTSTEAINRNTEGFTSLIEFLEEQAERERALQRETLSLSRETNAIVHSLHRHITGSDYLTYIKGEEKDAHYPKTYSNEVHTNSSKD